MREARVKKVEEEIVRLSDAIEIMKLEAELTSYGSYWGPKETGAVRRASMDLTRALAELRKTSL